MNSSGYGHSLGSMMTTLHWGGAWRGKGGEGGRQKTREDWVTDGIQLGAGQWRGEGRQKDGTANSSG